MTKIYLIRHAEAEGNLYRIAHGWHNGLITNYRGYQQIDALRQRFQDVDIDAVYASDLYRTQITARAIWLPKALPLHLEPAFREIHMGVWEDHPWHELNKLHPEEMYHFNRRVDLWHVEDPEENGTTFLENAIIKAQAAVEETGLMAIADDSGLVVDALDGEPGVYSARYAGVHGDDAANNAKLLVNLEGVADEDRTARFMSVVALIDTDGLVTYGEGACEGVIAHEGRGEHGFGYDPLFLPVDTPGKTMAELTADEKNAISHRFHALEHLSAKLTGEE